MREIPNSVKVGARVYDVFFVERIVRDGEERSGEAHHGDLQIRLLETDAPTLQWETFWHEIVHCVNDIADCGMKEAIVNRFSMALASVLLDNGFYTVKPETIKDKKLRVERSKKVQDKRDNV